MWRKIEWRKLGLMALIVAAEIAALGFQTGTIRWDQINSYYRHGTGVDGQSSDGTGTSGHVPTYSSGALTDGPGIQGTDANLLSSGTISGTPGLLICTDSNGGATTSGCTATGSTHAVGATFSGGGAQSPQVYCCTVVANSGTITAWDIVVDDGTGSGTCSACTATIKFWRVASGTTTPTSADSINTSGVALSTGTSVSSTTLTDFTSTTVTAGDRFAIQLSAVANAVVVTADIRY